MNQVKTQGEQFPIIYRKNDNKLIGNKESIKRTWQIEIGASTQYNQRWKEYIQQNADFKPTSEGDENKKKFHKKWETESRVTNDKEPDHSLNKEQTRKLITEYRKMSVKWRKTKSYKENKSRNCSTIFETLIVIWKKTYLCCSYFVCYNIYKRKFTIESNR